MALLRERPHQRSAGRRLLDASPGLVEYHRHHRRHHHHNHDDHAHGRHQHNANTSSRTRQHQVPRQPPHQPPQQEEAPEQNPLLVVDEYLVTLPNWVNRQWVSCVSKPGERHFPSNVLDSPIGFAGPAWFRLGLREFALLEQGSYYPIITLPLQSLVSYGAEGDVFSFETAGPYGGVYYLQVHRAEMLFRRTARNLSML
eukprot:m.33890 g.33890  ORF g.33890 m.33890 type:complete len:199 (-) comp12961_c0_seq1:150-746(-)